MTDKDIIFSLECCDNGKCSECSFAFKGGCTLKLRTRALDLINRQQAEIERLNNLCEYWEAEAKEARAELPNNIRESVEIFIDRLGNYIEYLYNENCDFVPCVRLKDIEKAAKEMVGIENET